MADDAAQSWMYWQYKYYNDITTCTPEGEALFYSNGTACESKLRALSRTYPIAVAGSIDNFSFDAESAIFTLSYTPLADLTISDDPTSKSTEIYFNAQLFYSSGANVDLLVLAVDGTEAYDNVYFSVTCSEISGGGGIVMVEQTAAIPSTSSVRVEVTITPCSKEQLVCSCQF
jgi:hypothetical protein